MSNYSIGLSGLNANSGAIDVISNNIANSSTVGYKAGEFIFQDQFYRAINPLDPARAGQGTAKQNIRRLFNMGSIQDSQNSLDMAITGASGMFRLSDGKDPELAYYTRNGQFAISRDTDPNYPKRNYIVNQNGMYLTGYTSQNGTDLSDEWTNKITMPPTELEPVTTTTSTIAVNLDSRENAYLPAGNVPFNPEVASSYNNRISQTVYSKDDHGGAHTVTLFYRRVDDKDLKVTYDGNTFTYPVSEVAQDVLASDPENVVLTADTTRSRELMSAPDRRTTSIVNAADNGSVSSALINVKSAEGVSKYSRLMVDGIDVGASVIDIDNGAEATTATTGTGTLPNQHVKQKEAFTIGFATNVAIPNASPAANYTTPNFMVGDKINFRVNGEVFTYTLTAADTTVATVANNVVSAFNGANNPSFAPVEASVSSVSGQVVFTARTAGKTFTLAMGDANGANEEQRVTATATSASNLDIPATRDVIREDNARTVEYTFTGQPLHFQIPGYGNTGATYTGTGVVATGSLPASSTGETVGFSGADLATALANAKSWMNTQITAATPVAGFANMESVDVDATGTKLVINYRAAAGTATNEIAAHPSGTSTLTATDVTWPQAQKSTITIGGNYAVGDTVTLTINGQDFNYTVTAADIQAEGTTQADFERIANSIMTAYNNSILPGHTPVSALSVAGNAGPPATATITFQADVAGTSFTIGSATDGAGGVTLDKAITLRDGQKVEFFNPISTMPTASSSPAGSDTVVITPDASIERGQFVYKTVMDTSTPPQPIGLQPLRDANGVEITVKSVSGSTLTLSAAPVPTLSVDELSFFAPVAYRLTMQDGSMVSMSGDLFRGEMGQEFTAVTSKYEIYASLDDQFFNSGNNLFSSNPGEFASPPIGNGTYKPIAEMQFWGGQNIDSMVTNEVTGRSTFDSKVTLTGKIKTQGDVATSSDPDLVFDLDLTGTKNFATPFGVDESSQNGRSVALLNSVIIDDEGKVVGQYGDGRQFVAGQVVLVAFANTDGLVASGANAFNATYLSGDEVHPSVIVGKPGNKGLGGIRSGAVEGSNVDLANELVKLLIQQRMYSANSQSIRAFDDTLTTTIRMAGG